MGNYVTVAEVRAFKIAGEVIDLSAYTDDEVEEHIGLSESFVEAICNDIFYAKDETNRFDGNGLTQLHFQPLVVYPLISIVSCKDIDIDGAELEEYVEGDDFVRYDHYIQTALAFPEDRPRRGVFRGGVWPKGQKNIVVEGRWGREETPPEIKRAVMLLTLESLQPGSTKQVPVDAQQIIWPDFTVTFKGTAESIGMETGFPQVDRLLYNYVNWVDLFQVVSDKRGEHDRDL